tara:strand:- start:2914 stop:3207 length:294 start_codon:yes stop_codon:yes gene_type:complete
MIKFIKNLFRSYKKTSTVDNILREVTAIEFLIQECYTMQDFIYCKKKIRQFQNRWDNEEESFGSAMSNRLNNQYNSRLIRQKYQIELYAQKARKKKV